MTKVDRLTCQLEAQEQIVATAGFRTASLQEGKEASAARLDLPPLALVVTPAPMGTPLVFRYGLVFPLPELRRGVPIIRLSHSSLGCAGGWELCSAVGGKSLLRCGLGVRGILNFKYGPRPPLGFEFFNLYLTSA